MKYRGTDDARANATTNFISKGFDSLGVGRSGELDAVTAEIGLLQRRTEPVTEAGRVYGQDNGRADTWGVQERARGISARGRDFVKTALSAEKLVFDTLKISQLR